MLISFLFQRLVELVYLTFAKLNNDFEDELASRSKIFIQLMQIQGTVSILIFASILATHINVVFFLESQIC